VARHRDIVGSGCVKHVEGNVVVEEEKVLDTWEGYYDRLSNEELVWDKHSLSDVGRVSGPSDKISAAEVKAAMANMKNNKAAGLSVVVSEIWKALGRPVQSGLLTCAIQVLKLVRFRKTGVKFG